MGIIKYFGIFTICYSTIKCFKTAVLDLSICTQVVTKLSQCKSIQIYINHNSQILKLHRFRWAIALMSQSDPLLSANLGLPKQKLLNFAIEYNYQISPSPASLTSATSPTCQSYWLFFIWKALSWGFPERLQQESLLALQNLDLWKIWL